MNMGKAILFGNGINIRLGIDILSKESIKERFLANILRYNPIFTALFNIEISRDDFIDIFITCNDGIWERLLTCDHEIRDSLEI